MAFLTPPNTPTTQRVADRQVGETLFGQLARFVQLLHTESEAGVCQASILVEIGLHSLTEAGELGVALTGPGFARRLELLEAKNNTLVDAQTGQILAIRQEVFDETWLAKVQSLSQDRDTLLQGDFFKMLRDNGLPGTMTDMIRQHIQQADQMGRFA